MTIEFKPLCDALGAEIVGVNLTDNHSDETIANSARGIVKVSRLEPLGEVP